MNIYAYDYNLLANGTLQDYLFAIHEFAAASVYWELDAVITSGGAADETNITRITIQLVSDNTKKVRFEPRTVLSRNTIAMWFSDGGGTDYGFWSGELFGPIGYIDGFITAALGTGRTFQNATYGCQNTTGNKGATFVETSDMFSMFVYGKSSFANHWQFGVQAGRIAEWVFEGFSPWGIMAGNPAMGPALSATTAVNTSVFPPGASRIPLANNNDSSKSCFFRAGNDWLSFQGWGGLATGFTGKLGDPSGTQYEPLSPIIIQGASVKNANIQSGGFGFTPYIRQFSSALGLDTIHDSAFSSTVSWRLQYHVNAQETLANSTAYIWPRGIGTTGTAI